ncbi:T9SS type B sorting domain-containing protein [uncultured Dokdonia sp.]|uniref:T9SS type B sorting domain-containing protein n=1 Tax=uncultured Dokdonia sp. TaxID=575653 RepID=UPI00260B1172|nr:T9SS type B sorting domain-containing protein [uncultured Dokdonia sp.]
MKNIKIYFILFLNFCPAISFGQLEASNWYFGRWAGLDFNTTPPTPLFNGFFATIEGCSTMSNADGELLFYTNGTVVRDKNHDIVPNGLGLEGHFSSSQSSVIVPKPNDPNLYYIFTVDVFGAFNGYDGLRYSEFNLSLNSGNGDITENKNIPLAPLATEALTAIQHANGVNYWVVAHEWESNNFLVYAVTALGVDPEPDIYSIGLVHDDDSFGDAIGCMKISPNGRRIAVAKFDNDSFSSSFVQVFDFNSVTGAITNPLTIDGIFQSGNLSGAYGIEFSPNSNLLYVSDTSENISGNSNVYQFDLSLSNPTDMINNASILYSGEDSIGAIQLGIDGRIYLANNGPSALDVIQNPDSVGVGANYLNREIDLGIAKCRIGLPSFIQSYFYTSLIKFDGRCAGEEILFSIDTEEEVSSVFWDFGDGATSDIENPVHIYQTSGFYTVNANVNLGGQMRTSTLDIFIGESPIANTVSDFILCDDISNDEVSSFDLNIKISEILGPQSDQLFDVAFYENLINAENDQDRLPLNYSNTENNQEVFVRIYNIENPECFDITSFLLVVHPQPIANSIEDLILCDDETNDDVEVINLSQFDQGVLQNQEADQFNVTYYLTLENAVNNENILPNSFQNVTNPQELFARIEYFENPNCFDITNFNIIIDEALIAYQPPTLFSCDDPETPGSGEFDLTAQNEFIINNQEGTFTVSYYLTEEDAIVSINSLNDFYANLTNPQELFARIEDINNPSCYDVTSFEIFTLTTPDILEDQILYICRDETKVLTAETGFDHYLWSTGETTESIVINEPDTYTIEITQDYNTTPSQSCTNIKTITVIESDEATITDIEIDDWSPRDNSIVIIVEGIGDYEYSINGIDYFDSNFFNNLTSGEYTAYVRDKNNCGIVTQKASLLHFPNFFTPNGDGYNDHWQIILSRTDPTLEIYIYDRYGKLMIALKPNSLGWDGTYNGKQMPSTDYWFRVVRPSVGEIYKGHFSLKR